MLLNTVKHARTDSANLQVFHSNGRIKIIVEDQGVGFDPDEKASGNEKRDGFGLSASANEPNCYAAN